VPNTFSTPEIRVDCPDNIKFKLVDKITEHFKKEYKVIDIDGARVLFDGGWGLVRASNTQPALVLRFEALSERRLAEIKNLVESTLEDIKKEI
jgi:phosphomannomutase/phosphoglucomutase